MAVVRNLMVRAGADFSKMRAEMQKAQKDLQKFKSSVGKTIGWIGAGLAALGVGKGLKDSVAAINHTIEQETKLATVMRKTMGATDDAIAAMYRYTDAQEALGVVSADAQKAGAAELSTYLSQTKSLQLLIPALNDLTAAQYGFTASAEQVVGLSTMLGKVMDGQVGALSRYGFTFDEAQEKILKYGTEAQRAALLVEIISDSVGGMNEALRNTPQGQMLALKNTLGAIQSEIGRGLLPIIQKIMPYLQAMANWFLRAAQAVSAFTSALFGKVNTGAIGSGVSVQTEGVEELGDAYDETGKKAKKAQKATAGFDQLNTIGSKSGSAEGSGLSGASSGGVLDFGFDEGGITDSMSSVAEKAQAMGEKVKNAFRTMKEFIVSNKDIIIAALTGLAAAFATFWIATKWGSVVTAIQGAGKIILGVLAGISLPVTLAIAAITALVGSFVYFYRTNEQFRNTVQTILQNIADVAKNLWNNVLVPFGKWLGDGFVKVWHSIADASKWLWNNVLVPFGQWLLQSMPVAWQAVTKAAEWLWKNVLVPFGNFLKWLWTSVLVPVGKIIGEALAIAFKTVSDIAKDFWQKVLVPLGKALSEMLQPAVEAVVAVLKVLWENVLKPFGAFLGQLIKGVLTDLVKIFKTLWDNVLKPLATFIGGSFKSTFSNVFDSIGGLIDGLKNIFIGLMNFITGVFTEDWRKAWEGVKKIFKGVFDSLWSIVKFPLNQIIDGINAMIGGLNKLSFDVPDWVPSIGGKSFGINIPKIPKLAKGGLAYGPTLSVVGDNHGARANPEVIAPLNKLQDIMDNSNQNHEVVTALGRVERAVKGINKLQAVISRDSIGRATAEYMTSEQRRTGRLPFPV